MGKEIYKGVVTFLTSVIFLFSGCSSTLENLKRDRLDKIILKEFCSGAVRYELQPGAEELMNRTIWLRRYRKSRNGGETLPRLKEMDEYAIYKEADGNDNKFISLDEAEDFFKRYSKQFEDRIPRILRKKYRNQ